MPTEFDFNQSSEQMFFFFINAEIDGEPLEVGEDWIAAFKGDLCVGARQWSGTYTDVGVMGDDGESYSDGYMNPGEHPVFKIYDNSTGSIYDTVVMSNSYPFTAGMMAMVVVNEIEVIYDCNEVLGGDSQLDNCGVCVGGSSCQYPCDPDCAGVWGG